jgi:2-polyprenyl-3-methyl-5-hydroxy-6-metoxy-1,4-benzoquinol methylase
MNDTYDCKIHSQLSDFPETKLGLLSNATWNLDPKRLVFLLSRYKFVSKMLAGSKDVLEVGCGDAFGSRIVKQDVESLTVLDIEPGLIRDIKSRKVDQRWAVDAIEHDMLSGNVDRSFDAAYSLDVLEHIDAADEDTFLNNIKNSVRERGVVIVGMPSLESQEYASRLSKEGHINCKSGPVLKSLCEKHFENVFLFSMNDEVVHTGFSPMAHYIFALCVK